MNLANANPQKTSNSEEGQTNTEIPPVQAWQGALGPNPPWWIVDEGFGLDMDFADVSAGGGDALDNFDFDFDSFLETDKHGMGLDFPDFDASQGDSVAGAREHTPQLPPKTDRTQQHGQKRSYSAAFPVPPKRLPVAPCRKRRASSLDTDSLSGVQALLQRWFDASATAVLLSPSDG
jgi:hypothetical protein